jgi:hypothetical protein
VIEWEREYHAQEVKYARGGGMHSMRWVQDGVVVLHLFWVIDAMPASDIVIICCQVWHGYHQEDDFTVHAPED